MEKVNVSNEAQILKEAIVGMEEEMLEIYRYAHKELGSQFESASINIVVDRDSLSVYAVVLLQDGRSEGVGFRFTPESSD